MREPKHERIDRQNMAALVERAVSGDDAACRELVMATLPFVRGLLFRLVGQRHELNDLTQNVYVRCLRGLANFRAEAAFTSWLGGICVNVALTHHQQRAKEHARRDSHADVELHLASDLDSDAERRLGAHNSLKRVAALLQALSPKLRIPFILHVIEEFDVPTVAAMTKSSVAATYKNIERARAAIAAAAERDDELRHLLDQGGGKP